MKKTLMLAALLTAGLAFTAHADPLAHLEGKGGIIDITGYETVENDDKITLAIFATWQNTTDKNSYASENYYMHGFQNGKELNFGWLFQNPEGYDSAVTEMQPGYSLDCYYCLTLQDYSPVDLTIYDTDNRDNAVQITVDPSSGVDPSSSDVPESVDTEQIAANDTQSLEQRVADLEERVEALEILFSMMPDIVSMVEPSAGQ